MVLNRTNRPGCQHYMLYRIDDESHFVKHHRNMQTLSFIAQSI